MRSTTKRERCRRFVKELSKDYVRKFGFGIGSKLVIVGERLEYDEDDDCVRFYVTTHPENSPDETIRFALPGVFFDPGDDARKVVHQVADDLELERRVVRRRLEWPPLKRERLPRVRPQPQEGR